MLTSFTVYLFAAHLECVIISIADGILDSFAQAVLQAVFE